MNKFLTQGNEIVGDGFRISAIKNEYMCENRYIVFFKFVGNDFPMSAILADFPKTPEGRALANELILWIWKKMLAGEECIDISKAPMLTKEKAPEQR